MLEVMIVRRHVASWLVVMLAVIYCAVDWTVCCIVLLCDA